MTTVEFELTPDQHLREACEIVAQAVREICDVFVDLAQRVMNAVREFAISLARFFLKLQLLEWKIPYPLADFVARNTPWYWAWRIRFNWFVRKYALKE